MSEIPYDEEVTRDWDWFAVDKDDNVGHFATGTFRRLPPSARADLNGLEELIDYFESIPEVGKYGTRPEFEQSRSFRNQADRLRYLQSFSAMAARGLYSYDAELTVSGGYRGVAIPMQPLKFSVLPAQIQKRLGKTRAPIAFATSTEVSEEETLTW